MADRPKLPTPANAGKPFAVHPAGPVGVVCVDIVDMGYKVETPIGGGEPVARPKAVLVFQSTKINPDTQMPFEPSMELTMSAHEKANLRKLLDSWLGKTHTDDEAKTVCGALDALVGRTGLANIIVNTAVSTNRPYAKIQTLMPLPEGMPGPVARGYTRAKFWTERKAAYEKDYLAFCAKQQQAQAQAVAKLEDFPPALQPIVGEDDQLPF